MDNMATDPFFQDKNFRTSWTVFINRLNLGKVNELLAIGNRLKMAFTLIAILLFSAFLATELQAQDLFIPAKDADWIDDDPFLQQTVFEGSNCYYFCNPALSWHKKYALSLHDSTLVYVRVLRDDWKSWLLTGFWKPKTLRYEMNLRQTEQRAILDLLEAATQTAKPRNMDIGIDGATCYLCHNARKVEVHSPFGGTLTTLTVNALDSLCYATEHNDRAVLLRQIETCRTLTEEFRQLYQSGDMIKEGGSFEL